MSNITPHPQPDALGHFGTYGGMFVPETLMAALTELAAEYERAKQDPLFKEELDFMLREYVGRPTPLTFAERWSEELGGARIFLIECLECRRMAQNYEISKMFCTK